MRSNAACPRKPQPLLPAHNPAGSVRLATSSLRLLASRASCACCVPPSCPLGAALQRYQGAIDAAQCEADRASAWKNKGAAHAMMYWLYKEQ
ncbi:hypothetical protein DUNSADRAFT_11475 [Dunaliella salina]|uniref:Uncharacterized protein n=1 Tax=Dunaliella salina TaxID=3046 RepID=A0ABQ7GDA9_DUNSA|nr:hypothetical protein DUNSADRAFT_11475 [Dunaliella salina]|eukprot:KAF5832575.1 hypothetical protein DUNSADRAFT_11475 [Dunaliella salina]